MQFFIFLCLYVIFLKYYFFGKDSYLMIHSWPLDLGDYVHVLVDVYACRYIMHVCAYVVEFRG